jgi:diguanylate cyclase (GGDEF)-like protein/PAS domain S-box-containing protein
MRIAYKLPIFLVGFIAACAAVFLVFEAGIIIPGIKKLERESALSDQNRVLAAIDREGKHLAIMARDWSQWDDCLAYIQGSNPGFIKSNIDASSFKALQVAIIAIYDRFGQLRFSGEADPEYKNILEQRVFPARAGPPAPYLDPESSGRDLAGILSHEGKAYLIASSPILPNDGVGPAGGVFIICRSIDEAFTKTLSEQTEVPLSLEPARGNHEQELGFRESEAKDAIVGDYVLRDIYGEPALVARTRTSREISSGSMATMRLFRDAMLAASLLFSLALIAALSRLVSRPIADIRRQIGLMEDGITLEMPPELVSRKDEVGALAVAFSELSRNLAQKRIELEEANGSLEQKVEERTYELGLLAKVVESTSEAIVLTDLEGTILKVNEAFCLSSGYAEEELLGKNPRMMKADRHDEAFYASMWRSISEGGSWSGEIWDRKKSGEIYPRWLTINRITDAHGAPRNYVGVSADISEIKATEERLHQLAYYDPLTGLPNRALFLDRLDKAVSRGQRSGDKLAVIFLDLDRFKYVNDTLGHAAGDKLLIEIARRIASRVRASDTVCRLGGDEFTILLEGLHCQDNAAHIAEAVLGDIAAPVVLDGRPIFVGASLGIALFPEDDGTAEGLTRKADAAMYSAKEAGRNTYRFASGETESSNRERLELDLGLRRALERSELLLYYQPIVEASGEKLVGAEALLRWRRPDSPEPCLPERTIALAEESGLILKIGDFVMREACARAASWRAAGRPLRVGVNVSARQFEHSGLLRLVKDALSGSALDPAYLDIEITESALMADMDIALRTMLELKSIGVSLSVDDFGTGYASLSYLSRFPVDKLKIDRSFIKDICTNPTSAALVSAILAMASSMGIGTIAEGVETEEQRAFLAGRGCSEIQGYYFSRPLPPERFIEFSLDGINAAS